MAVKFLNGIDVDGSLNLSASDIPNIDAGKITSGTFSTSRIPNLDASKITSGTLSTSRIPDLSGTYASVSHSHTIANVTGLQTALDGKQAAGTYNTIIGTDSDINTGGYSVIDNLYMTDGVITSHGARNLENIKIVDTRAAQRAPNDYLDYGVSFEFTDKITSGWHSAMTLQGWHDGYAAWQLVGPSNTSTHENLYFRSGVNTTWGSLRKIWHDGNLNALTNATVSNDTITFTKADGSTFAITTSDANTNYYLNGITKSGNTLTFSVNGTTNQTYTFGSNAFTSYSNHVGLYDSIGSAAAVESTLTPQITDARSIADAALPKAGGTMSGTLTASGGINGLTLANGISGTNFNITGVNQLEIADPGEGIIWKSGASGNITLAVVDDASDNRLNLNGTGASLSINNAKVATESWVNSQGFLTSETDSQTLSWNGTTGVISITGGNSIDIDGRYAYASHDHSRIVENSTITYGSSQLQWTDQNGDGGTGLNGSAPDNPFSEWWHHIVMNHANSGGYYVDIAACFHSDDLYFRRLTNGSLSSWREIIHDGNISSFADPAGAAAAVESTLTPQIATAQTTADDAGKAAAAAQAAADAAQATADTAETRANQALAAIPTATSQLTNDSGFITDGNTNWNNTYGFITASSTATLTNKSGNISQWTNDSGYLTSVNGFGMNGIQALSVPPVGYDVAFQIDPERIYTKRIADPDQGFDILSIVNGVTEIGDPMFLTGMRIEPGSSLTPKVTTTGNNVSMLNRRPDVFQFQGGQVYGADQWITLHNTTPQLITGDGNAFGFQGSPDLHVTAPGLYEVSYSITFQSQYANRSCFGVYAMETNGSTPIAGSRNVQYFRYNTYGQYTTITNTFYWDNPSAAGILFVTNLLSGAASHKVFDSSNTQKNTVSIKMIKEY